MIWFGLREKVLVWFWFSSGWLKREGFGLVLGLFKREGFDLVLVWFKRESFSGFWFGLRKQVLVWF